MREAFTRQAIANIVVLAVVIGYQALASSLTETTAGVTFLVFSIGNFFLGVVVSANSKSKNYVGRSFFLLGAITMLCSFTLCSHK